MYQYRADFLNRATGAIQTITWMSLFDRIEVAARAMCELNHDTLVYLGGDTKEDGFILIVQDVPVRYTRCALKRVLSIRSSPEVVAAALLTAVKYGHAKLGGQTIYLESAFNDRLKPKSLEDM